MAKQVNESAWSQDADDLLMKLITLLSCKYRVVPVVVSSLQTKYHAGLKKIYETAQHLSLTIKRDVLSVRMVVTVPGTTMFDDTTMKALWEQIGQRADDRVIGAAAFGLVKIDAQGREVVMLRCKVVTTSLLRHMGLHLKHL